MPTKKAVPMKKRQKLSEKECALCEYSTADYCGLLAMTKGGTPICPFCATGVTIDVPLPERMIPKSDMHLLGAWRDFSDKLLIYQNCNANTQYHMAKVRCDEHLPEVLADWGNGDLSAGACNAHSKCEEYPLYRSLWPMLHFGRVLQRISTAYGLSEVLMHSSDIEAVKRAIAHPEVQGIFNLFLSACTNRDTGKDTQRHWELWGEKDGVYNV